MGDEGQKGEAGISEVGVLNVLQVHFERHFDELIAKCLVHILVELECPCLLLAMFAEVLSTFTSACGSNHWVSWWVDMYSVGDGGGGEIFIGRHCEC
eukprot:scaffold69523_cov51-Attheya_sp.AAC.1